jgi:putative transposase
LERRHRQGRRPGDDPDQNGHLATLPGRHPVEPGQLIGHADAGSQYTAIRFTEHLELEGIRPSIGSVGDAFDDALMECVIGLYKTEYIRTTVFHEGPYRNVHDVPRREQ